MSQTHRRDQLFEAYTNTAVGHGVPFRDAKDAFSAVYTACKHLAYPVRPKEHSTQEERDAYEAELRSPTTLTDKARRLDVLMAAKIEHPEWLASALLKPRRSKAERRAELEAKLARLK